MPGTKSRWRRILVLIGILAILLGLLLVALPVWFPWLARPVARSIGFEFEGYRRLGLARFELTGVTGRVANVEIAVGRLEALLPHGWLWERWRRGARTHDYASATDWVVRVTPRVETDVADADGQSTLGVLDEIDQVAQVLRNWIPAARLRNGTIHALDWAAVVPEADWRAGQLELRVGAQALPDLISAQLEVTRSGRWETEITGAWPGLRVTAELFRNPDAWDLKGILDWRSNRVEVTARFDESGWFPAQADISGEELSLEPEFHGLPLYGPLHGEFALRWRVERYTLAARGQAEPVSTDAGEFWPRFELDLNGQGDLRSATVDALEVRAPWFNLRLREPMPLGYTGPFVAGPGAFELRAVLEDLRPDWQGQLTAELEVRPGTNGYPAAVIRASSAELSAGGIQAKEFEARGSFDWPRFELERGEVLLGTNSRARAQGIIDLQSRELSAVVVEWRGDDLGQFLPDTIGWEGLEARVRAAGPWDRLSHHGELEVARLTVPQLNPLALSVRWQGDGFETATGNAQVSAGDSRLLVEGEVQRPEASLASLEVRLDMLTLERLGRPVYQLDESVRLRWQTAAAGGRLEADAFAWKGTEDRFLGLSGEVQWPTQGQARLTARKVAIAEARDFWPGAELPWTLTALDLTAGWTNGPVDWQLEGEARLTVDDQPPVDIGIRAQGDEIGADVESLTVRAGDAPQLLGRGTLPLALDLAGPELVRLIPDTPIEFSVAHQAADAVVVNLGAEGRLELSRPTLEVLLTGTVRQPRGELRASLAGASWHSNHGAVALPRLERARLEAELRPDAIQLKRLEFELDGQPVAIQGEWPLADDAWTKVISEGVAPDWQRASARVLIEEADLAPVAQHLPTLLTSQGKVRLDLRIQPGLMLDGFLSLTNAMTRPLGPLAPVREIEALVAFSGRTARLDRFSARLGGRPIHASGHATLSDARELLYSLRLQGTNAPLMREPGLLLRANFDLALANRPGETPTITGAVQLRDGLLLQDVSALLVDRLERPALHPPYFSVTNLPFARWELNVKVTGDRFLRVRSPAFIGAVSADGVVQGSLGRPVIDADVRVPSGRILFPFGKLEVEGAYATLSGEDPRGPVIDLVAAGHNFGYNVRLEVTGTMDNLNVLFSATPPLSSEDILLMLTAGELPNQEITYSTEARAGRLITYLGREVATRFFGDEMGEERLIINSGENITRSGRTTYSIEYRLTPRWSLVGEYDEFNALNAGLKWRIYSR